jgi:DNA-binding IclR family transcriptional regulator
MQSAGSKDSRTPRRGRPARLTPSDAGNRTVLIGIELLKTVARAREPITLTQIARESGMLPSRAHRYVASLKQAGFLRQDAESGKYDVGPAAIELGLSAVARIDGVRVASDIMTELTADTGLVSYLCVWGSNGPTVIKSEFGNVQTAVRVREGSNLSMLTATGRIFLAYYPREETQGLFDRDLADWNASTPPSRNVKAKDVARICEKVHSDGIARTVGLRNPTWTAFSTPVFRPDGKLAMALTVIGITSLFDTQLNGPVAQRLKQASQLISSSLGTRI